jgi:hypothetical protein
MISVRTAPTTSLFFLVSYILIGIYASYMNDDGIKQNNLAIVFLLLFLTADEFIISIKISISKTAVAFLVSYS